jgi:hypothetical protein
MCQSKVFVDSEDEDVRFVGESMGSTAFFSTSASTPDALAPAASIFSLSIAPRSSVSMLGCLLCNGSPSLCASVQSSSWLQTPFLFLYLFSQSVSCLAILHSSSTFSISIRQRSFQKNTKTLPCPTPTALFIFMPRLCSAGQSQRSSDIAGRLQTDARSCGRAAEWGGVHHNGQTCGGLAGLESGMAGMGGLMVMMMMGMM